MRTIVVGAGSAGAVDRRAPVRGRAARRRPPRGRARLPAGVGATSRRCPSDLRDGRQNSMHSHDWGLSYRATDHRFCSVAPDAFPRGRVVGGSSAVNTCIALRGQPYDYDEWAALGLPEWSWEQCLPAFKRLETDLDFDNEWHGKSGPIPIRRHPPERARAVAGGLPRGVRRARLPALRRHERSDEDRRRPARDEQDRRPARERGARATSRGASARDRTSRSCPHTLVRRVRFAARRVTGVEVERSARVRDARRAIASSSRRARSRRPGILLRSGIGPAARPRAARRRARARRARRRRASARSSRASAIFFLPREAGLVARRPSARPDGAVATVRRAARARTTCSCSRARAIPLPRLPLPGVTLATCVGKPRGHGRLRYLSARAERRARGSRRASSSTTSDRARAREALRWIGRLSRTKAIRALARPVYPSRRAVRRRRRAPSARSSRSPARATTRAGRSPMGAGRRSARGRPTGAAACAASTGLFVADASLMPTIPTSNTNLPTLDDRRALRRVAALANARAPTSSPAPT